MRRLLQIGFWLAVGGVLAVILLTKHEYVEQLETRVNGNIRTDHLDRIWFAPNGELVGIGLNDSQLIVRVWAGNRANPIRERTLSLPAKPVFAVSGDASQAAWVDPAGVHVTSLIPPQRGKTSELRSSRSVPVSSLAFTGSGKLAALYRDGELEIVDVGGDRVAASTHLDIADPGQLIASGSYLAAYSSANGNAYVFDTAGDRFSLIEHKKYPQDVLTLTLSAQARFAVATREAIEQPGRSIPAPGRVRSLAFFDRDRVLAAGDFQGIYLLGGDQGPQKIADANPGTTALATTGGNLAFGNSSSLVLASSRLVKSSASKGVPRPSPWLLIALFGLLVPVLIYFFYPRLALIIRKALNLPAPEPLVANKPAKEERIPNALVEACQNGDCVLWAGSGLGAQAGLPTWTAFLPELTDWASKRGAPPIGRRRSDSRRRDWLPSRLENKHCTPTSASAFA